MTFHPIFKVVIYYDGQQYDFYIGEATSKSSAERKAIALFKAKHKGAKGTVVAHAFLLSEQPPIVRSIRFMKSVDKKTGMSKSRMRVENNRLVLKGFDYIVSVHIKTHDGAIHVRRVSVMASSVNDALLKGKKVLAPEMTGGKIVKWQANRR